jgi:hypothetical protein
MQAIEIRLGDLHTEIWIRPPHVMAAVGRVDTPRVR